MERVAEEVAERFPEARLALLSSDLVPGLTEMREMIKQIEAGEIDIIIGTQMVAKGHHFPGLCRWSASSMAISASRRAQTRAPASARSSSCIR